MRPTKQACSVGRKWKRDPNIKLLHANAQRFTFNTQHRLRPAKHACSVGREWSAISTYRTVEIVKCKRDPNMIPRLTLFYDKAGSTPKRIGGAINLAARDERGGGGTKVRTS